jgi:hypothetical protein
MERRKAVHFNQPGNTAHHKTGKYQEGQLKEKI